MRFILQTVVDLLPKFPRTAIFYLFYAFPNIKVMFIFKGDIVETCKSVICYELQTFHGKSGEINSII